MGFVGGVVRLGVDGWWWVVRFDRGWAVVMGQCLGR